MKLDTCLATKANYAVKCKRDWYDDWTCVECCQGDLCNYYVTVSCFQFRFRHSFSVIGYRFRVILRRIAWQTTLLSESVSFWYMLYFQLFSDCVLEG